MFMPTKITHLHMWRHKKQSTTEYHNWAEISPLYWMALCFFIKIEEWHENSLTLIVKSILTGSLRTRVQPYSKYIWKILRLRWDYKRRLRNNLNPFFLNVDFWTVSFCWGRLFYWRLCCRGQPQDQETLSLFVGTDGRARLNGKTSEEWLSIWQGVGHEPRLMSAAGDGLGQLTRLITCRLQPLQFN